MVNENKPTIHKPQSAPKKASAVAMKANHNPKDKKKKDKKLAKKIGLGIGGVAILGLGGCSVVHMLHSGNKTSKVSSGNKGKSPDSTLDFKSNKDKKKSKKGSAAKQSSAENNLNSILKSSSGSSSDSKGSTSSNSLNNLFNGTAGGSGDSLSSLASAAASSAELAESLGGSSTASVGSSMTPLQEITSPSLNTQIIREAKDNTPGVFSSTTAPVSSLGSENKVTSGDTNKGTNSSNISKTNSGSSNKAGGNNNSSNQGNTVGKTVYKPEHENWDYTAGRKPTKKIVLVDSDGKEIGSIEAYVVVTNKGNGRMSFTIHYNKSNVPKGYKISDVDDNTLIDAYFGNGKTTKSVTVPRDPNYKASNTHTGSTHDSKNDNKLQSDNTMTVSGDVKPGVVQHYIKDFTFDGETYDNVGAVTYHGSGDVTQVITLKGKDGKTYQITRTTRVGNNESDYDSDANTTVVHVVTLADANVKVGEYYNPAQPKTYSGDQEYPAQNSGVTSNTTGKHSATFRIGDTQFKQTVNFYDNDSKKSKNNSNSKRNSSKNSKSTKSSKLKNKNTYKSNTKSKTLSADNNTHSEAKPKKSNEDNKSTSNKLDSTHNVNSDSTGDTGSVKYSNV